jgi:hypothetical protein
MLLGNTRHQLSFSPTTFLTWVKLYLRDLSSSLHMSLSQPNLRDQHTTSRQMPVKSDPDGIDPASNTGNDEFCVRVIYLISARADITSI